MSAIGTKTAPLTPGNSMWRVRTVIYLALLSALSMAGAFWLRFDLSIGWSDWLQMAGALPLALGCRLISFYYFRLDRRPHPALDGPRVVRDAAEGGSSP